MAQDKRNFRFPAFSDSEGVKLDNGKTTDNFLAEQLISAHASQALEKNEDNLFNSNNNNQAAKMSSVSQQTTHQANENPALSKTKAEYNPDIPEALDVVVDRKVKRQPTSFSTYAPSKKGQPSFQPAGNSFALPTKRDFPIVKGESAPVEDSVIHRKNIIRNLTAQRNYFVPKYVPASLIVEEETPKISAKELYDSMQKTPESFLLFGDQQEETDDVAEMMAEEHSEQRLEDLPENRPEIFPESVLETAENAPMTDKSKKGVLEKGLKSIFEEEQPPFYNRYFDQ